MNKGTKLRILAVLISLTLGILVGLNTMSVEPKSYTEYHFQSTGTAIGENISQPPTQPIGGISNLVLTIVGLITIASALVGLYKWLSWRTKYGKSRTPIVLRHLSKES